MSGGKFDYKNDDLKHELFGWNYNESDENGYKMSYPDPMHDRQISELVYDVLVLLHELDWAESGDNGMKDYDKARRSFKKKWLSKNSNTETLTKLINDMFITTKEECIKMIERKKN